MLENITRKIKIISQLYPYLWPKNWAIRLRFLIASILLLTTIVLNVGVALVLKEVITAISTPNTSLFLAEILLISYGVVWTLNKAIEQLRLLAMNRIIERGIRLLTLNIFDKITKLLLRYHADRKTGAIISAVDRAQFAFPGFS